MAEAKLAPSMPEWMVKHANLYLASGGNEGHTYKRNVPGRGEITAPALLVGGRYDECTPGHLTEMATRISGSQLEILEDASHLFFAEQPEVFADLVNAFLDRHEGP